MNQPQIVVHTEIRATSGPRFNDLHLPSGSPTLYEVLESMSSQEWAVDLFTEKEGRVTPVTGFLMVLGNRMVQHWEVDDISVSDGQNLKFVQVVPGG